MSWTLTVRATLFCSVLGLLCANPLAADEQGRFLVHEVESPYQAGKTKIHVLLPDQRADGEKFHVLYVLPVEKQGGRRYGDELAEIKKHDLHNKHQLICVAPEFSHLPWYADHPTDKTLRQESHFLKVVVPLVEKTYPAQARAGGRLLLGFSKSGWGAWSLLLRHPDKFYRAAAWDAPLVMDWPSKYGSRPIFGTQANFERYKITSLLKARAKTLGDKPRLIHLGYGNFRADHEKIDAFMKRLNMPHIYLDGPKRKHAWSSDWVPEAVRLLVAE